MSSSVEAELVKGQILRILQEAFDGASGDGSWFLDHDRNAGWIATLDSITPGDASRPIGGSTIAAHAHHMQFSLEASASWIRGERVRRNWGDSWRTRSVNAAEWLATRSAIQRSLVELREAIAAHAADSADALGGAVAVVAHAAYHLGAIRQKLLQLDGTA